VQSGLEKRPEELAAEVLKSLRKDIEDQLGFVPARAVISVPALFELPQSSATSEAARLAGFERVELLQEPIASALAAGWTIDDSSGSWLVYDLGGGTFDVSLLETRDGLLRVVGHDGDNFLGGRDFDWAIVDWLLGQIEKQDGIKLSRSEPGHAAAIRKIKLAAEEAKIELSRVDEASITVQGLEVGGARHDLEYTLDRSTLERLCAPTIERSLTVCRRLLAAHGVPDGGLTRVVLVGGPSVMPTVRRQVSAALGVQPTEGLDPMTLVAQGAAIYAATAGLEARPQALEPIRGCKVWLQYPAMSSDLTPHVVGRLVDRTTTGSSVPAEVRLTRADGLWDSEWTAIDEEGAFVLGVSLVARKPNVFRRRGAQQRRGGGGGRSADADDRAGADDQRPAAVADDRGGDRGRRRARVLRARGAAAGAPDLRAAHRRDGGEGLEGQLIKIPIVQGEYDAAHLCRLVGSLQITRARAAPDDAVGDRARADDRARPRRADVGAGAGADQRPGVRARGAPAGPGGRAGGAGRADLGDPTGGSGSCGPTRSGAGLPGVIDKLGKAEAQLVDLALDVGAAKGGDTDAAQKARRSLIELDALLESVELDKRWPELEREAREAVVYASLVIHEHGLPHEQTLFTETAKAVEKARHQPRPARAAAAAAADQPAVVRGRLARPGGVEAALRALRDRHRQHDGSGAGAGPGQGGPRAAGQGRQRGAAAGRAEAVAADARGPGAAAARVRLGGALVTSRSGASRTTRSTCSGCGRRPRASTSSARGRSCSGCSSSGSGRGELHDAARAAAAHGRQGARAMAELRSPTSGWCTSSGPRCRRHRSRRGRRRRRSRSTTWWRCRRRSRCTGGGGRDDRDDPRRR
jgi:molecular chaperone DnaK